MKPFSAYRFIALFLIVTLLAPPVTISAFAAEDSGTWRGKWWNYYERGMSRGEKGEWDSAIEDMREAIDKREKDQRRARTYGMHFVDYFPHRELGVLYFNKGQIDKALAELELSQRSEPSDKTVFYLNKVRQLLLKRQSAARLPSPEITISSPAANTITSGGTLRITGSAKGQGYISRIVVNGQPFRFDLARQEIPFELKVPLEDGTNRITIVAEDLLGGRSEKVLPVILKREGPAIAVSESRLVEEGGKRFVRVVGEVLDSAGIGQVTVAGVAGQAGSKKQLKIETLVPVSGSPSMVSIEATDLIGNRTVAEVAVQPALIDQAALAQAAREEEERARRTEEEQLAREKAELARVAAERAEKERIAREKAEQERQARIRVEQERLAKEKAEQERLRAGMLAARAAEAQRLALLKAEEVRLAREAAELATKLARKAAEEKAARERAEAERLAREKAEQVRLAFARAEQELFAKQKAEAERIAQEMAEQERQAREKAELARVAAERAEQERLAREKAEQERLAKEKAEAERLALEKAEQERLAVERVERERLAKEKAEAERIARAKADQERLAKEKAEAARLAVEKAEQERLAKEKAEQERLAREKAEQERITKEKAGQERLAKEKAEQERIAKEKAEAERIAKEKAEQERLAKEKAEQERVAKEKAEQERIAREMAEQERLAQAKAEQERLLKERDEQERLARERLVWQKLEAERIAREKEEKERQERERAAFAKAEQERTAELEKKTRELAKKSQQRQQVAKAEPKPAKAAGPDTEAPLISLKEGDEPQSVFGIDTYALLGHVTDNRQVAKIRVAGADLSLPAGQKVYFSKTVRLKEGQNKISIEAFDQAGNRAVKEITVVRTVPSVMQPSSRISMLVLPPDPGGRDPGAVTPVLDEYLSGAFVKQKRFKMVERKKVKQVLDEQKFSAAMSDPDQAIKIGNMAAADMVLAGTIREDSKSVEVFLRVINSETAEQVAQVDGYTEDKGRESVQQLVESVASKVAENFPVVEGVVIERDSGEVMANVGIQSKLKQNMGVIFFRKGAEIKDPTTGKVLGVKTVQLGDGKISEVQEGFSKIVLSDKASGSDITAKDMFVTK